MSKAKVHELQQSYILKINSLCVLILPKCSLALILFQIFTFRLSECLTFIMTCFPCASSRVQCCYFNKDSDFHFVRVGVTAVNIAYILFSDDGLFKVPHLG